MASFAYGLAKGLQEPCSPYRSAYYFGAELNKPSADGWNCLPDLVGPAASFNLSAIPMGREVLVALLKIQGTPEGTLDFRADWYRDRDNALLFSMSWSYWVREGSWIYFYSYLGYVDWEISENGSYRVEFTVAGALSYRAIISFTITGIPVEVEPLPVPGGAIGWISQRFATASAFFYQVYLEAQDWIWPLWLVSDHFYSLSRVFSDLSWDFYHFNERVEFISGRLLEILSWETIWDFITARVPNLGQMSGWFYNWWGNVSGVINDWWGPVSTTVLSWVNEARQWAWDWIDYLQGRVDELRVLIQEIPGATPGLSLILDWLTNWTGHVLTTVNAWWTGALAEVRDLIGSAFIERESLWAGWQDMKDQVIEFFSDPLSWLEGKFADWFLGAE